MGNSDKKKKNHSDRIDYSGRSQSRKLSRTGRRGFVKLLSKIGVSGAAISSLSGKALAELTRNPDKEVPRLRGYRHKDQEAFVSGEDVSRRAEHYTIPREQWRLTETTFAAASRLSNRFDSNQIQVGTTTTKDGRYGVVVQYHELTRADGKVERPGTSLDQVKEQVPTNTTGVVNTSSREYRREEIPVFVQEKQTTEQGEYFYEPYRPVPASCEVGTSVGSSAHCSTGLPAYSDDITEHVMTTASHCVDRKNGEGIYQSSDSYANYIGETIAHTDQGEGDGAAFTSDDGVTYDFAEYSYKADDYLGDYIVGVYWEEALKDMDAQNETIHFQGRFTGREQGELLHLKDLNSSSGPKVEIDADSSGGDSGGAYWGYDDNGDAWSVGVHAWGSSEDGRSTASGNAFYYLEDKLNLTG